MNTPNGAPKRTLISKAYEGDNPPGVLSVGLVSLVELCQHAMPKPAKIREKMAEASLEKVSQEQADKFGAALALDQKMLAGPVRNLKHDLYAKERAGALVLLLISEGQSDEGPVVFATTLFTGAVEADVVKAVSKVTDQEPSVGSVASGPSGDIRRVYWDIPNNTAGVRFFVASGPADMDADHTLRAVTAFNKVA